jgi:hypothetical protein
LTSAHKALLEFVLEFEHDYYQRKVEHLHMVCQSVHTLTHAAPETLHIGPLGCLAQWTIERSIGNLGQEIRQPSNPYANLAQRGALRAQVNALKSMIPDIEPEDPPLPDGSIDLGGGYALLRAMDNTGCDARDCEVEAIKSFAESEGADIPDNWNPLIVRWARLRLPNEQVAHSAWKEKLMERPRVSRMVKVYPSYFQLIRLTNISL